MFTFLPSDEFKIELAEHQKDMLSSAEKINKVINNENIYAFDIFKDELLIGFALFRKYEDELRDNRNTYFLWDYAIDLKYQNKGFGFKVLKELIMFMKENYEAANITTTYIWGNEHAKRVYEKVGFVETDVIDEDDIHEVNMIIEL